MDSVFISEISEKIEFELHTGFDATQKPYILHLNNSVLIPQAFCGPREEIKVPLAQKPWRHLPGRVLWTADNRIIRDSFYRSSLVPPRLEPLANGQWRGTLPDPKFRIDDDCVFVDLLTKHFGHMLLETPARHWPDLFDEYREAYRDLKPVATRTHGLSLETSAWPKYLTDFLKSLEISFHDIHFIDQPTSFRSLFLPSRISPYSNFGMNRSYFDLLNRSATWLRKTSGLELEKSQLPNKVYLSRSELATGNRSLANEIVVEDIFRKRGFDIIHPQKLDLRTQTQIIDTATHIAGISGSQLHLGMYRGTPGLKLLRITPAHHAPPWDEMAARFTGTEITTVSFSGPSRTIANASSNWELNAENVACLTERVDAWLR